MSQDYNPSLVTKSLVFCGDAAMKSAAGPATLLYDKVNDNNGTMYNGAVVQLDGGDEYLDCGVIDYSSYTGLSVCAWINGPGLSAAQTFVSNWGPTGTSDYAWLLFISQWAYNTPDFLVSTNGTSYSRLAGTSTLASGQWHHLVGTWESGSMKLYLNGVLDASGSGPTSIYNPAYKTAVGADFDGGTPRRPFNGTMADVRVYDKVLSLANVKEIYDDSKVIIPTKIDGSGGFIGQSNLKIWLPLMEGAGTIGYDGSGNGNNGIGTNFDAGSGADADWLTGQTGAPQLVEGYNRPLLGDAATDLRVNFGDPSTALDIGTGQFTIAYWIYPKTITGSYVGHVTYTAAAATARFEVAFHGSTIKIYTTNSSWNDTGYAPPLNKWTHILFKRESGSITMHVDGLAEARWTLASSVTLGPCTSLTMLNHGAAGGYPSLDGLLNEVVFYNVTSTDAQIAALAAKSPAALSGELTSSWVNRDFSAFSSSGTNITNMVSSGTGQNAYAVLSTPCVVGNKYKISFAASSAAPNGLYFSVSKNVDQSGDRVNIKTVGWAAGSQSYEFTATDTWTHIGFQRAYGTLGTEPQIWDWSFVQIGGPLPPDPKSGSSSLPAVSSLKGYWRNDSDVTWTDLSGNGNDGTVTNSNGTILLKQGYNGSASTSTSRDNQGFPLKYQNVGALGMKLGVEDAVNLGSAPAFAQIANPGAATIGTWIRVDSASDLNALMGPWVGTGNAGWGIFTNYSGGINMIVDDGADGSGYWVGQNTPKAVVPADGSFHYVVLTVVRNGVGSDASVSHYLDGVFYNTKTFSNENGANAWGSGGSTVFKLGNMNGNTNYFNGQIANLHMYNRVLGNAEITQNFNAQASRFQIPRSIVTSGLVLASGRGRSGIVSGKWNDLV